MAVSPMDKDSKRIPISSSSSKLKQINQGAWDKKKLLAKERVMGLTDNKTDEGSVNIVDNRIMPYVPKKAKSTNDLINNGDVVSTAAMERALEIQHNLSPNSPSFHKNMLKSHVTRGFWLGLPKQFCVDHLPEFDKMVVLVGESEIEYDAKYLVDKNGLSGGWKGFAIAHKLVEGDVLVFELLKPCKFKVHIVRASEFKGTLKEEDNASQFETVRREEDESEEIAVITETLAPKYLKPVPLDHHKKKKRKLILASDYDDDSDEPGSEIPNSIILSESLVHFKDVKCFDDFKIQIDGLILDSEISKHLRKKYYELCVSQNKFLHENLVKGLNSKLAAGMISETINIADAIRAAKLSSASTDLESYCRTLKAFEDLGMAVGFLRARIDKLLGLSHELQAAIKSKRNELDASENEMKNLKAKMEKLIGEIYGLNKLKNEKLGVEFTDIASGPW